MLRIRDMKKTMIYLPDEMHRFLGAEAARRHVSMAEIVREALAEYRADAKDEAVTALEALIGTVDEPDEQPTNVAEHVDDVLGEYYSEGGDWDKEQA